MAGTEKILFFLAIIDKTTQMRAYRVVGDHRYRRLRLLLGSGLKQIHRPNRHILIAAPFVFLILNNSELHWLAFRQIGHISQADKLRLPFRCRLTG